MKYKVLRQIIERHIKAHKALVHNACQNEMEAFKKLLEQKRTQYEAMELTKLKLVLKTMKIENKVCQL